MVRDIMFGFFAQTGEWVIMKPISDIKASDRIEIDRVEIIAASRGRLNRYHPGEDIMWNGPYPDDPTAHLAKEIRIVNEDMLCTLVVIEQLEE